MPTAERLILELKDKMSADNPPEDLGLARQTGLSSGSGPKQDAIEALTQLGYARGEAVRAGTVCMAGTKQAEIYGHMRRLLDDPEAYRRMGRAVNPYGDGEACRRIGADLAYYFGLANQPEPDFKPL